MRKNNQATPAPRKPLTLEVDGEPLCAEDFVFALNPRDASTWALPYGFSDTAERRLALQNALRDIDTDRNIPKAMLPEVRAKLKRLCRENGVEVPDNDTDSIELRLRQIQLEKQRCL